MAWGIFKKIGQGLKKAFNWTKDHIIKPVAGVVSKVAQPLGDVAEVLLPGTVGKAIHKGVDYLSKFASPQTNQIVGANGHGIRNKYIQTK